MQHGSTDDFVVRGSLLIAPTNRNNRQKWENLHKPSSYAWGLTKGRERQCNTNWSFLLPLAEKETNDTVHCRSRTILTFTQWTYQTIRMIVFQSEAECTAHLQLCQSFIHILFLYMQHNIQNIRTHTHTHTHTHIKNSPSRAFYDNCGPMQTNYSHDNEAHKKRPILHFP